MKAKFLGLFLLIALILFGTTSCKSTAPVETAEIIAAPEVEEEVEVKEEEQAPVPPPPQAETRLPPPIPPPPPRRQPQTTTPEVPPVTETVPPQTVTQAPPAAVVQTPPAVVEPPPAAEEHAPEVTDPPSLGPDALPPNQESLNNLNAVIARAAEARKFIQDFEGNGNFPSDWNSANTLMSQAERNNNTSTAKDVRESTARFEAAAQAYENLAGKTSTKYFEDARADIVAARNDAINAGAENYFPAYLHGTDEYGLNENAMYQRSQDHYRAKEQASLIRDAYLTLGVGAEANAIRLNIDEQTYRLDRANIDAADRIGLSALEDYEAHNIASASAKANDIHARYTQTMNKYSESIVAAAAALADTERQRAIDARANVAVKDDFLAADEVYISAIEATRNREYTEAIDIYNRARTMFVALTQTALQRRAAAEAALRTAELKMIESDALAHRAELIIEGDFDDSQY